LPLAPDAASVLDGSPRRRAGHTGSS
jgi:hypothetical protein